MTSEAEATSVDNEAGDDLHPSRRLALTSLWGLVGISILVYAPILGYMVHQWSWDDDYSHGFLIVPLAVWFAWGRVR